MGDRLSKKNDDTYVVLGVLIISKATDSEVAAPIASGRAGIINTI
jgi:hypothetical protein